MKGYILTPEEKEQVENKEFAKGQFYKPLKDVNGAWFIFEQEHQACGLGIESQYIPPQTEELL